MSSVSFCTYLVCSFVYVWLSFSYMSGVSFLQKMLDRIIGRFAMGNLLSTHPPLQVPPRHATQQMLLSLLLLPRLITNRSRSKSRSRSRSKSRSRSRTGTRSRSGSSYLHSSACLSMLPLASSPLMSPSHGVSGIRYAMSHRCSLIAAP